MEDRAKNPFSTSPSETQQGAADVYTQQPANSSAEAHPEAAPQVQHQQRIRRAAPNVGSTSARQALNLSLRRHY